MTGEPFTFFDRPRWIVPTILKWLTIIPVVAVFIMFAGSMWLQMEANAFYEAQPDADITPFDFHYVLWDAATELIWLVPTIGFLWLLSTVADKADQLVWQAANQEERAEIIRRRRGEKYLRSMREPKS